MKKSIVFAILLGATSGRMSHSHTNVKPSYIQQKVNKAIGKEEIKDEQLVEINNDAKKEQEVPEEENVLLLSAKAPPTDDDEEPESDDESQLAQVNNIKPIAIEEEQEYENAINENVQLNNEQQEQITEGDTTESDQLEDADLYIDLIQTLGDFFTVSQAKMGKYKREIPQSFKDNAFMKSVIQNYAIEEKEKDKPLGKFFLDEMSAQSLASEVLSTKKGFSKEKIQEYLDSNWARSWLHYDVNQSGLINADKAPVLMRYLASDQSLEL